MFHYICINPCLRAATERLSGDSILPFGYCCLTLAQPKVPLISPHGYIFDKDSVIEFLAEEKARLKAAINEWEEVQKSTSSAHDEKEKLKKIAIEWKNSSESSVIPSAPSSAKRTRVSDDKHSSFWMVPVGADSTSSKDKPDGCPRCPASGERLRYKDLLPVRMERTGDDTGKDAGVYCCSVTKRPITHQQTVYIKPSGIVMLESAYKEMVESTGLCPITAKRIEGVIPIKRGGTGFSAHSKVEAKGSSIMPNREIGNKMIKL